VEALTGGSSHRWKLAPVEVAPVEARTGGGRTGGSPQAGPQLSSRAGREKRRSREARRNDRSTTRDCSIPVAICVNCFYIGCPRCRWSDQIRPIRILAGTLDTTHGLSRLRANPGHLCREHRCIRSQTELRTPSIWPLPSSAVQNPGNFHSSTSASRLGFVCRGHFDARKKSRPQSLR
jgi:hypothetical protein